MLRRCCWSRCWSRCFCCWRSCVFCCAASSARCSSFFSSASECVLRVAAPSESWRSSSWRACSESSSWCSESSSSCRESVRAAASASTRRSNVWIRRSTRHAALATGSSFRMKPPSGPPELAGRAMTPLCSSGPPELVGRALGVIAGKGAGEMEGFCGVAICGSNVGALVHILPSSRLLTAAAEAVAMPGVCMHPMCGISPPATAPPPVRPAAPRVPRRVGVGVLGRKCRDLVLGSPPGVLASSGRGTGDVRGMDDDE